MTDIPIADARRNLGKIVDRALRGEEIVITRRGKPEVRLTVIPRRRPGLFKGRLEVTDAFFEPLPPDELKGWLEE